MASDILLTWLMTSGCKLLLVLAGVWLYKELTMGICRCRRPLRGKTVVMTVSCPTGLETAVQLAGRGARVVVGCCSPAFMPEVRQAAHRFSRMVAFSLDLTAKANIQHFAQQVRSILNGASRIDVLIANAAIVEAG